MTAAIKKETSLAELCHLVFSSLSFPMIITEEKHGSPDSAIRLLCNLAGKKIGEKNLLLFDMWRSSEHMQLLGARLYFCGDSKSAKLCGGMRDRIRRPLSGTS